MVLLLSPYGCGGDAFTADDDGGSGAAAAGGSAGNAGASGGTPSTGGSGGVTSTGGRNSTGGREGDGGSVVSSDSGAAVDGSIGVVDSGGSGQVDTGSPCGLTVSSVTHTSGSNHLELGVSHTVAGLNRLLLVGLAIRHDDGLGTLIPSPTAVSYGSAALAQLKLTTDGYYQAAELWALIAPPLGTQQVTVQFAAAPQHAAMGVMSFTGAAQTGTFGDVASIAGGGTTASLLVPSTGYAAVVDLLSTSTLYTWTAAPGQEELWRDGTDILHGASTFNPVIGDTTALSWSGATVNYVLLGAPIAEVACD